MLKVLALTLMAPIRMVASDACDPMSFMIISERYEKQIRENDLKNAEILSHIPAGDGREQVRKSLNEVHDLLAESKRGLIDQMRRDCAKQRAGGSGGAR